MLTPQEKNDLYEILIHTFGNDPKLKSNKEYFNEQTLQVAEQAINEDMKCNTLMRELVSNLASGSSFFAKGWLRKVLRKVASGLKDEEVGIRGYACMVGTKSRWLPVIIATTI